jgi:enamine deaminase RidA (YjgF/YER057c/UK114 family)
MARTLISSGAIWESTIGYSRAVKVGNTIEISGTTSIKDGKVFMVGDYYGQTKRIYEIINETLSKTGSCFEDVTRVRVFVLDISKWEEVGKAHAEIFSNIKPAMSMIGVSSFIDPDLLVEIEVTAIINP